MNKLLSLGADVHSRLDHAGSYYSLLVLRIFLAYEYLDSGITKFNATSNGFKGDGWTLDFPFPFSLLPIDVNWFLATWSELIGGIAILIGLATRFFAASLIVVTIVAWITVHGSNGYNVGDNGYKFSLIFIVAFIPLLLNGAGKFSIDSILKFKLLNGYSAPGYSTNPIGTKLKIFYALCAAFVAVWSWKVISYFQSLQGLKGDALKAASVHTYSDWISVLAVVCIIILLFAVAGILSRFTHKWKT